jgi:hypothetical protein
MSPKNHHHATGRALMISAAIEQFVSLERYCLD